MDDVSIRRIRLSIQAVIAAVAVGTGGVAFAWMTRTRPSPVQQMNFDRMPEVSVRTAQPKVEQTPIVGHGTVRPKSQINIVPQVSGTLVDVHPNLAQGRVVPKGALLFQIDKTVYEARVQQARGEVKALEAALARHDQEVENLAAQIETAEQLLAIDENEFLSSKKLFEVEKVGTKRDVDATQQRFLRQKSGLTELQSRYAVIPHLRLETQAQLESARARLQQAQYELNSTTITCPFEARVESIAAHTAQFVTAHLSIATLTDVEAFEVSVGIDPRELRWLNESAQPQSLSQAGAEPLAAKQATIRWRVGEREFSWKGRVTRFEKVDEATRTARMVVEVRRSDLMAEVDGSVATALSIGMYCTAELPSVELADAITVPRHAIHENQWVYILVPDGSNADTGTLQRRRVPMLRTIGDEVLVDFAGRTESEICELAPGERIVVSTLSKPVVGMRVKMRESEEQITFAPTPFTGDGPGRAMNTFWSFVTLAINPSPFPGLALMSASGLHLAVVTGGVSHCPRCVG